MYIRIAENFWGVRRSSDKNDPLIKKTKTKKSMLALEPAPVSCVHSLGDNQQVQLVVGVAYQK